MADQSTDGTDKGPSVGSVSGKEPDLTVPDAGEVEAMTLAAFARAGLVVKVDSDVLGAEVLFVSDNVPEEALDAHSAPVYRADELSKLARLSSQPRTLRQLNVIKEIFQGSVTAVEEVDDD